MHVVIEDAYETRYSIVLQLGIKSGIRIQSSIYKGDMLFICCHSIREILFHYFKIDSINVVATMNTAIHNFTEIEAFRIFILNI
jgi:hypothetical protein